MNVRTTYTNADKAKDYRLWKLHNEARTRYKRTKYAATRDLRKTKTWADIYVGLRKKHKYDTLN